MKIKKIKIFKIDLPMKEGSYSWAKQSFSSFDSTVITIETDTGIVGVEPNFDVLGNPIAEIS